MTNWNCDGSGPHVEGEVKLYPLGGGGNAIFCRACFRRENDYRRMRQSKYWANDPAAEINWPMADWDTAKVYVADR
jgi:hypothetical protein